MDENGDKALEIIGQMDELTKRVKAANEARAAFVEERTQMVAEIIEKIKQLKLTNVSNGAEIKQLKQQLADNKEQLEKLTQDVKNNVEGGEVLQKQINVLKAQIEEKDKELTEIKAKLAESEHVLGMSDSEMVKLKEEATQLKSDLEQVKNELQIAKESQTSQNERASDLQRKLEDVDAGLKNTYKNLKKEVEELLNAVGEDNVAQKAILKQILDALEEGQEAISSRIDDVAGPISSAATSQPSTYTPEQQQIINDFDTRFLKYFDEVGDEYIVKEGKTFELTKQPPLKVPLNFFKQMQNSNPDMYKKWVAYKKNGGTDERPKMSGGRKKRVTQRKHPRNKKVTKKLIKRRATQKKRRRLRKHNTVRK
jgi:chromosome segregation ATPase